MRTLFLSLAALCCLSACGNQEPATTTTATATTTTASTTEQPDAARAAAIQAATQEARAGLPRFWELQRANDGEAFWLKVAYATPDGGSEQIWLNRVRGSSTGLTGVIQNQPTNVPSLQLNQRAPINVNQITDWSITRNGHTYGHYTTRAIYAYMSPEEKARNRAFIDSLAQGLP
ncbi:MAG: DUF2314 domain-containing protein [Vitreimonas sp.]